MARTAKAVTKPTSTPKAAAAAPTPASAALEADVAAAEAANLPQEAAPLSLPVNPPITPSVPASLGRIVLLRGRNAGTPPPADGGAGSDMVAIITRVLSPHQVDLCVFAPGKAPNASTNVPYGDAAGNWYWPPRV